MDRRHFAVLCALVLLGSLLYGSTARATDYPEVDDMCHKLFPNEPDCQWYHKHFNYPIRPSGLAEINRVFGYVDPDPVYWSSDGKYHPTCQARHSGNFMKWKSADHQNISGWPSDDRWPVYFHNKLGGDKSSNLDWDVKGHYKHGGWMPQLRGGIFGSYCRYISQNTPYKVSTHAWGIAVDINAAHEHYGHKHACHTVTNGMANVWSNHKWYWGAKFKGNSKDCMHFQYARGY